MGGIVLQPLRPITLQRGGVTSRWAARLRLESCSANFCIHMYFESSVVWTEDGIERLAIVQGLCRLSLSCWSVQQEQQASSRRAAAEQQQSSKHYRSLLSAYVCTVKYVQLQVSITDCVLPPQSLPSLLPLPSPSHHLHHLRHLRHLRHLHHLHISITPTYPTPPPTFPGCTKCEKCQSSTVTAHSLSISNRRS